MTRLFRLFICLFFFCLCAYHATAQHNELRHLQIALPIAIRERDSIEEENAALKYEIATFESPRNLMRLARTSEYSHLKWPESETLIAIARPQQEESSGASSRVTSLHKPHLIVGAAR